MLIQVDLFLNECVSVRERQSERQREREIETERERETDRQTETETEAESIFRQYRSKIKGNMVNRQTKVHYLSWTTRSDDVVARSSDFIG